MWCFFKQDEGVNYHMLIHLMVKKFEFSTQRSVQTKVHKIQIYWLSNWKHHTVVEKRRIYFPPVFWPCQWNLLKTFQSEANKYSTDHKNGFENFFEHFWSKLLDTPNCKILTFTIHFFMSKIVRIFLEKKIIGEYQSRS